MSKDIKSIEDLELDAKNANKGTERACLADRRQGRWMLEQSLREGAKAPID